MVEISIIIPVRYRADLTQVCIDSIMLYTKDHEIIIVQEGEDEEIKRLCEGFAGYHDNIQYVQNIKPKGYAGALNTGLELATGKYICFMNNDTVATPGWMDEMLLAFKETEQVGLVVPTFWGSGDSQSVDWNDGENFSYVNDPYRIIGVCFVIPKEILDKVGTWDENFFHGGEDLDLAYRIDKAEYDIIVARKSFIYHYGGASTRELFDNDINKTRSNAVDKLKQFAEKHNVPIESIYEKINQSKRI